jgi:hypothetical protein
MRAANALLRPEREVIYFSIQIHKCFAMAVDAFGLRVELKVKACQCEHDGVGGVWLLLLFQIKNFNNV